MSTVKITYFVQVAALGAVVGGLIVAGRHAAIIVPIVAGAIAFEIAGYVRTRKWTT